MKIKSAEVLKDKKVRNVRELQKSGGSRAKKYPKIDPPKQENCILLHFYITILKCQVGQLTPLTPSCAVPVNIK